MVKEIYRVSLRWLADKVIDLTPMATPKRYRFFDCDQFANHHLLRIYEFTDISDVKYATMSYVWKGNPVDAASRSKDKLGTFDVKGAKGGDPISIDLLLHVCKAAVQENMEYIWMDRIGMLQANKDDKGWQIQKMHSIYKGCGICFVLPGGVRRLVDLTTPTTWMHRGWTLQEVMAPKRVKVVFAWPTTTKSSGRPKVNQERPGGKAHQAPVRWRVRESKAKVNAAPGTLKVWHSLPTPPRSSPKSKLTRPSVRRRQKQICR